LISTSRHITQGIVDVLDEKWEAATMTLTGRSKIVGGDPYELRIVLPQSNGDYVRWKEQTADVSGDAKASVTQDKTLVRVMVQSPQSAEVNWTVKFSRDIE
ncbi:MAG TPA: hypothetical protein VN761_04270, partial [Candidatus Polarisedimenticolia bacterium]|nr:hypothetical protein [Candidatus Polarisedimenticolia bacterium]